MKLTVTEALMATVAIGFMMFLLRFLPFLIFAKKKTPAFFSFIEKFIPAVSIAVLFVICLKERTSDLIFNSLNPTAEIPAILSAVGAALVTTLLHLWKNNAMLSIFGGTIVYMIFNYLF